MSTFVDDVLAGRATLESLDDYIDRWHDGDDQRTLSQFLGLSTEEYAAWARDAKALARIIAARSPAPRPREPA